MNILKTKPRHNLEDLSGRVFNKLTVLSEAQRRRMPSGMTKRYWLCQCECGTIKEVLGANLKNNSTLSCGCYRDLRNKSQPKGELSTSWKGGRRIESGYVLVYLPDHPKAKSNGYVREHIVVMENKIKRPLLKHENVHHKNGDKTDNRPDNLELWNTSQPAGQRVEDKLAWAKEIVRLYE